MQDIFYLLNTLEKKMALLFLGFKNYSLRPHGEGVRQCEYLADKREAGGQFLVILCGCVLDDPLFPSTW